MRSIGRSSSAQNVSGNASSKQHTGGSVLVLLITVLLVVPGVFGQLEEGSECELHDGTPGICKWDNDCQWLRVNIQKRLISFSDIVRCSFSRNDVIICCGDAGPAGVDPRTVQTTATPVMPSDDGDIVFPSTKPPFSKKPTPIPSRHTTTTIRPTVPPTIAHFPQTNHNTKSDRPPPKPSPFPLPLTTNEILEINFQVVPTSPRTPFSPFLPTKRPSSKQPRFENIQLLPLDTNGALQPSRPSSVVPLKIVNHPAKPVESNFIQWPTDSPATTIQEEQTIIKFPFRPTTTTTQRSTTKSSFWSAWSANMEVAPIHQNGLEETHAHHIITTTTVRTSQGTRSTTPAPAHPVTDGWLQDLLAEVRHNATIQTARPVVTPAQTFQNGLEETHAHDIIRTTTLRTNQGTRSTTPAPVHPVTDGWLQDLLAEVRHNSTIQTARPVVTTAQTSSQGTRSTTPAPAHPVTDGWLQEVLAEVRHNASIQTAHPVVTPAQTFGDGHVSVLMLDPTATTNGPSNDIDTYPKHFPPFEIRPTTTSVAADTPTTVPTLVTSSTLPTRLGGRRKLDEACDRWGAISSTVLSFHILGGTAVDLGEYPHMAALGYPSQELNVDFDFNCGGTIISEEFILTAGHCVVTRDPPTVVRMGTVSLHSLDDPGVTMNIAEIIPHPNYVTSSNYNDIALVRLALPLEFTDNMRPACLRMDLSDLPANAEPTVTGWGKTEDALRSINMLKANLTSMDLQPCNATLAQYYLSFQTVRRLKNGLESSQICAYDPAGRKDACQGDSGGPLQLTASNGLSTVVGVTSFGVSCGTSLPSVYTRVAFYADWIESIVWPTRR